MKITNKRVIGGAAMFACALISSSAIADTKPPTIDKQFAMIDANKDGKISIAEHAAGAKSMFEKMDSDKNGKVTAAEMTGAHQAVTGRPASKSEMSSADKIKVVDSNGDGILTAEEHATASASMFSKMDTNKDGLLSKQEFAAGHASMLKKPAK